GFAGGFVRLALPLARCLRSAAFALATSLLLESPLNPQVVELGLRVDRLQPLLRPLELGLLLSELLGEALDALLCEPQVLLDRFSDLVSGVREARPVS